MRKLRLIETNQCYHLTSRLAHRAFFLTDEERTRAVALMRRVEEFSGVVVLAYAFMSNHCHIYVYVPEAEEIGEDEILRRIKALYRDASLRVVLSNWRRLKGEEDAALATLANTKPLKKFVSRFSQYKASFLRRMWNSSEFMRTFKQHFTMSYNGRREHCGTMWEGRYHDRNHKPEGPVMWRTSAYVDANPVTVGIANWPDSYKWCSFAAACRGDEKARRGYAFMYGPAGGWSVLREKHESTIREILAEINARTDGIATTLSRSNSRIAASGRNPNLVEPRERGVMLERGTPETAERILKLLESGPMTPAALREAVGIKSRIHFIRYYLEPLLGRGLIKRTIPDRPSSPNQKYKRTR